MKFSTDYLCNPNSLPDALIFSHNDSDHACSGERKCRGDGETPIKSGPQDSDPDKDKSSSGSNSSNSNSNNSGSGSSGGKKHHYA